MREVIYILLALLAAYLIPRILYAYHEQKDRERRRKEKMKDMDLFDKYFQ